jgi:hypothetical protein
MYYFHEFLNYVSMLQFNLITTELKGLKTFFFFGGGGDMIIE